MRAYDVTSTYLDELSGVAEADVEHVRMKDRSYGGSWQKRGGAGAFMMLARKWDRLENMMQSREKGQYDLFSALDEQDLSGADGSVLAEVRDLRRYLLLVEARLLHRARAPSQHVKVDSPDDVYSRIALETGTPHQDVRAILMVQRAHCNLPLEIMAERYETLSAGRVTREVALIVMKTLYEKYAQSEMDARHEKLVHGYPTKPVPAEDSNRHALQPEPEIDLYSEIAQRAQVTRRTAKEFLIRAAYGQTTEVTPQLTRIVDAMRQIRHDTLDVIRARGAQRRQYEETTDRRVPRHDVEPLG